MKNRNDETERRQALAEAERRAKVASERAALAAVLDAPERALPAAIRYGATGEDFEDKGRGAALDAALALFKEGAGVDAVTVTDRLIQAGDPEGAAAVEDALDAIPPGTVELHAEDHFRNVCRRAHKRRLSALGLHLSTEAARAETDPAALAAEAVGNLSRMVSAARGERTAAEIVAGIVKEWTDIADGTRERPGAPLPTAGLASALGKLEPGLHVVAGKTSAGKSIVEAALSRHVALRGGRVLRCCLDMGTVRLMRRDVAALCALNLSRLKAGGMLIDERAFLPLAVAAWRGLKMEAPENALDLAEIVAKARALKADGGLDLVTVDYVQEVKTGNPRLDAGGNANAKIDAVTKELKYLAIEAGVPILIVSQLSRAHEDASEPALSDLRDSGAIEQDASTVSFLYPPKETAEGWRDAVTRPVWYAVAKNQEGPRGKVPLRLQCNLFSIEDAARLPPGENGLEVEPYWNSPAPASADYPARVIAADGLGHFGSFDPLFLERMNAAAVAAGAARWETVEEVQGGLAKVAGRLEDFRRGRV